MCCGSAFWKGFLVFVLTFAGGVFISGLFTSNRACTAGFPPEIQNAPPLVAPKTQDNAVSDGKKCVPVDGNLKYERLAASEIKRGLTPDKPETEKKSSKDKKETQKKSAARNQRFDDRTSDKAEVKDLLHREKCFDVQDQK